ncbi:MAG: hypothetical protein P8N76_17580 [Pirellulaceae bacterium]|nr:hypothetical protein [Pirellulaceae bacterium]
MFSEWSIRGVVADPSNESTDLVAWGQDHLGQPMPEFMSGDECLFCHRDLGARWGQNPHQLTLRAVDNSAAMKMLRGVAPSRAAETRYLLGRQHRVRYLKRGQKFGTLDLLSINWEPTDQKVGGISGRLPATWISDRFAASCAGCHTSGVNAETGAFHTLSLDCFVCHGDVELSHSKRDTSVIFGSHAVPEARIVIATCGQCHLRGGQSKSTQRPYPSHYVAGDNLFRDFLVELSEQAIANNQTVDRHVYANTREVMLTQNKAVTCVTCHDLHQASTEKHRTLPMMAICTTCHTQQDDLSVVRKLTKKSKVCGY